MLTKKHFEMVAEIIAKPIDGNKISVKLVCADGVAEYRIRREMAHRFADAFASENPKFNRSRFLAACGVEVSDES